MALRVTFHELVTDGNGRHIAILGVQTGGEIIPVSAVVANSTAALCPCLVHFKADEDCYISIGEEDAATANIATSFPLDAGERDTRLLAFGQVLSVISA